MKKVIVFILLSIFLVHGNAEDLKNAEAAINKSTELYNKRQYLEALALLDSVKQSRDQNLTWYYYYALNQARLKRYNEALINLDAFIKKSDATNTAKAYYFSGLIQFYKGEYDKAINSLELTLDVSKDQKLDKSTDSLIDKVIKYRDYYETHKATNVTFLLGYNFDTNVLSYSKELIAENLDGHIINYGAAISHRIIDQYNFIFEPSIAVLDNYTLDSKFKANSTIQSNDILQVLLSTPVIFYFDAEKSSTRYDLSLNAYTSYLPVSSNNRELYLSSFFFKGKTLTQISPIFNLNIAANLASDKSYNYVSDDDDASGTRLDLFTSFTHSISKDKVSSFNYDLGVSSKNSKGINTRYSKYSLGFGFMYPSFMDTVSSLKLGYEYLNYPDRTTPRKDNKGVFDYIVTKNITNQSSVAFSLGADVNSSDVDLYRYSDFNFGVQYLTMIGF